ncbi:hypothetical protein DFQ30_002049, partial [Apophysomyces sp. BC1015]
MTPPLILPAPEARLRRDATVSGQRSLWAIPLLGLLILILLWVIVYAQLQGERESSQREAMASAALLSAAFEQHTVKAIHQVDQITRFVKYEFEKSPKRFDLASTIEKGVIQGDTLVQVSFVDEHGYLIANTEDPRPKPLNLSDRDYFQFTRRLNHPDGSFAGVVVVSEDPGYFTSGFYNSAAIGRHGVISVIADTGAVLARRTGSTLSAPGAFSAAGSYPLSEHVSGTDRDPIDGVMRIVSYRHIDSYPLGVMVGLSREEEFVDYEHTRNIYLLIASSISVALLGFFAVAASLIRKLLGREREMMHLVEYDLLTGLPNRYQTLQLLRTEVSQPANVGRLALLFIDQDNFKTVNDTLGHNAGDIVLQMTSARLAQTVGGNRFLARIGGDEFVVIVKEDHVEPKAVQLAEAILESFMRPFDVRGSSFVLHASIGITLFSSTTESEIDLLKKADLAMYSAKDAGRGCYRFYSSQLAHRADHLMKWEQQLRVALAEGQLFLAYQPKINLTRRCITGLEALLRWNHPQHGEITANEFITIAESTGLVVPIGEYVIDAACQQLAQWTALGYDSLSLSINISAVQFWRGDVLGSVERALSRHNLPARRIELEITETAMM